MNEPLFSIHQFLKDKKARGAPRAELLERFGEEVFRHLESLQSEGLAVELKKGWWTVLEATPYRAGRARVRARKTMIFLGDRTVEFKGNDLGAMDGDLILFRLSKAEAKPIRILERATHRTPGFVMPGNLFIPFRRHQPVFMLRGRADCPARTLVEAGVLQYPTGKKAGVVEILNVIGGLGDKGTASEVVILDRRIPKVFSPEAETEAAAVRADFSDAGPPGREDLRGETVFTIDPENARDFDDAVSLKPLSGGNYLMGVHIADVSHYVAPGSALDRDALERGNSVYFPDRVVPMLPEALSNDLCSLKPDQDRHALSVFAEVSPDGALSNPRLTSTVIHSKRRFTYQEAQAVLDGADDPHAKTLRAMAAVAKTLQQRRTSRGSLDFDLPEVGIVYDDNGRMTGVRPYIRTMAHRLVEEFMLAANRIVAQWLTHRGFPLLYRVHEQPDKLKFFELRMIVEALQRPFTVNLDDITPADVRKLLQSWEGLPEEAYLNELLLRSLMRACYSPDNKGHFALAFPVYCHFTSPIRRWADLQVHRQIKRALAGEHLTLEQKDLETAKLRELGAHISRREWDAEDAERDVLEWMTIQLLEPRVGEAFDARISGMSGGGMTVILLEFMISGFLPFSGFKGEFIHASTLQHTATAVGTGRTFRMGDPMRVRLKEADPIRRSLIFEPAEVPAGAPDRKPAGQRERGKPGPAGTGKSRQVGAAEAEKAATLRMERTLPSGSGRFFARAAFLITALFFFFGPWALPAFRNHAAGTAVISGVVYAMLFGNPFLARTSKLSGTLLGIAIVGMGFGMNLIKVLKAGADGIVLTVIGIAAGLAIGVQLGKLFKVSRDARWLIAVGTSICGGSAIAAVTPVLKAKPHDVALSIATIFILNAVALLVFPPLGLWMGLSQHTFGTWAALAIHDTSSVVGAAYQYGTEALEVGTTIKLARALWIVPVSLFVSWMVARSEAKAAAGDGAKPKFKAKLPWFIPGFLVAAAIVTYAPGAADAGRFVKELAQYLMVATLFLIGANLSRDKVRELGPRPFLLGVALWLILGTSWGLAAKLGWLG